MKEFWNAVQFVFTAVGGWLGYFLGGCDGLLYALLAFVVIDYITGVMCAISDQKLSSAVGFKGICRKVLIFLMVGIANIMDVHVIGTGSVLRTAAIFFYISNEGQFPFSTWAIRILVPPKSIDSFIVYNIKVFNMCKIKKMLFFQYSQLRI